MNRIIPASVAILLSLLPAQGGEATAEFEFPGWGDTSPLAGPIESAVNQLFSGEGLDVTADVRAAGEDKLRVDYDFADSAANCADLEANLESVNASFEGIGSAKLLSCSDNGGGGNSDNPDNILGSEIEAGSGWFWSDWLGAYQAESFPWIWTVDYGWWWISGSDDSEIYAYSLDRGAWLYTGSDLYPWVYDWSGAGWIDLSSE